MSEMLQETVRIFGLTQLQTSGSHPQKNGLVKSLNRTLKQMLCKIVTRGGKDWSKLLGSILLHTEKHLIHLQVRPCAVKILGFLPVWTFISQLGHYQ